MTEQEIQTETRAASHGISNMVPDGYRTSAQAASEVGRSSDTIKRWRKRGTYAPTKFMMLGKLKVWLYDDADVVALKEIAGSLRSGRTPDAEKE